MTLVKQQPTPHAERLEDTSPELAIGQWFRSQDEGDKGNLCVIVEIGSNYIELSNVAGGSWRVHLDEIATRLEELLARIAGAYGGWGAFLGHAMECHGARLDECAAHVGLKRKEIDERSVGES